MKVAIVGAGISGLALAYYLQKLGIRYDLFERSTEVGGLIKSIRQGVYQLELGPHSLQMNQDLQELVQELKLESEVIRPAIERQQQYIRKHGKYHCVPTLPLNLLLNSFFSGPAKRQISQEVQKPLEEIPEETVSHFFKRRFCQEVVDYLVQPMVAGIYAGNPNTLLLEKTFPEMKALERTYGSVVKGLMEQKQAESHMFTLSSGLQTLPTAIASKLISLHLNHEVEMIHKSKGKYFLSIRHDEEALGDEEYDLVVLALPAYAAAELLNFTAPGLAAALQNITYASLTLVHTAYHKQSVGSLPFGYGALHPEKENTFCNGIVWSSSILPWSCPEDEVLFSSFVGGSQFSSAFLPQQEVQAKVHQELKSNYAITAPSPLFHHSHTWEQALPQPDMFVLDVYRLVEMVEEEGIYACANWISGPTVSDCLRQAKQVAQKIYSKRPSFQ